MQDPKRPLKVLLVEDSPEDAELVVKELTQGGFDFEWTRVDSHNALYERASDYDIILSDFNMPGWNLALALRELKERRIDTPLIVISGSIGEEQAVETLREGAVDYVLKDRLKRLSGAVLRALGERDAIRALRDSEQRYRSMFQDNPTPMFVFALDTLELLDVNESAVGRYGYARDEFLSMNMRDIRPDEMQTEETKKLLGSDGLLPAGHRFGIFRHRKKDGTVIDVRTDAHDLVYKGRPARVVTAMDITAQKRAEERFRRIAETIAEVFWITDVNTGNIAYISPAYEDIWGRARDTLLANPQVFLESIHPDDRLRVAENLSVQADGLSFDHEYRILRPDGSVRWIWDRGFPITETNGTIREYVGAAQDVTARRHAEQALRDAEERMRLALEASKVGIWESNLWARTAYWSEICEAMHGLQPGTFGRSMDAFFNTIHPDDRERVMQTIEAAIQNRTSAEVEYRALWPDGTERLIYNSARFFYDENGIPSRGAGVCIDVTERRSLEGQLRQAQKMEAIGQLAGGVAHDFNNLLTAILGYTELLAPALNGNERLLSDLDQIRQSAMRATGLTRQLLAFSRRQVLQPVVVEVNALVADLAKLLSRLIGEDVELTLTLDPSTGRVKADPGQVEQVLMNLAVNARDAMPEGGRLTITTEPAEVDLEFFRRHGIDTEAGAQTFAVISVSDTGVGMDEQTKAHIFEPFFTTKGTGKGTGLGLATVYGIVKQSGGFIWVYSEPGQGATFKVYLPRTDEAMSIDRPMSDDRSLNGHETVLLVEDERSVRQLTKELLERRGYRVIDARDAEEAASLAATARPAPHLLLTDVVMPGRSGPELFKQLRPMHPSIKVLYMSGYTDEAVVKKGILDREANFLQKPFTASALLRKVRDVLDKATKAS